MIPILYDKSETEFTSYGLGVLADCSLCEVTEECNGVFECKFKYPVSGALYPEIQRERIIKAKPNDTSSPQAFRIYRVTVPLEGIITVYAQHISYDLAFVGVQPFSLTATSPTQAIEAVFNHATTPHNFTFQTDYSAPKDFSVIKPKSIRACLGGTEGSLMNLWGGEFEWDNFHIRHHQGRGSDNGVTIEYGKNLTKLEHDSDNSDVFTDLLPYAVNKTDEGDEVVTLPEVTLPISTTLETRKSVIKDFTDSFEDGDYITVDMLRTKAKAYIENNPLGVESPSVTVSFEPLWKQPEYAAVLERVSLCDTVTVKHTKLGITTRTKVIKTVYDTIGEKYISITLGSCKANLADKVTSITEEVQSTQKQVDRFPLLMRTAIGNASKLITGQSGGYVVLNGDESGHPFELLVMDAPRIEDAVNVWRWNVGGLGFSHNGYNGEYETAITADGSIVADFITTGSLVANIIKAGVLSSLDGTSYWNLETGEMVLNAYATNETVESVSTSLTNLSGTVSGLSNDLDDLSSDLSDLSGDVSGIAGTVGTLTTKVTTLTTKQATLESSVNGLTSSVSSLTTRMTTAEGKITSVESNVSSLQQTATEISATVSRKVDETCGSSSSSFGWSLKSTGFYVYSNASTVMSITSSGLSVVGAIDATSGSIGNLYIDGFLYFDGNDDEEYYISANYDDNDYYIYLPGFRVDEASGAVFSGRLSAPTGNIGGFTLASNKIYKTKTSYNDGNSGVYIGTDGIGLGAGTFYVTSAGKLYATDAEISGKITATDGTIGGFTINSTSLTNDNGGSYIQIKSGNYITYLGAGTCYSTYTVSGSTRGWSLSHNSIRMTAYANSVYAGIEIKPTYTKRSSYTSSTGTTVAEGCITTYSTETYDYDGNRTIGTTVPFIIGAPRGFQDAPYLPTFEWGSYLRFVNYQLAELVYDSYYGSKWQMRDAYTGKTFELGKDKFYLWTYTSSISDDAVVSCTQSTHGLSTVKGAIVVPRSTMKGTGSLSGYNNIVNNGHHDYGITISGTTVYFCLDYGKFNNGFYCLIYGS